MVVACVIVQVYLIHARVWTTGLAQTVKHQYAQTTVANTALVRLYWEYVYVTGAGTVLIAQS